MNIAQIYQGESIGITLHSEMPLDGWSIAAELFTSQADYRIVGAYPDREDFLPIKNEGRTLKIQISPAECAKLSEGILSLHVTLTCDHVVKKSTIRLAEIVSARITAGRRTTIEQQLVFMNNDMQMSLDMGPKVSDDGFSPVVSILEDERSTILEITDAQGVKHTQNLRTPANLVSAPGDREDAAMTQRSTTEAITSEQLRAASAEQTLAKAIGESAASTLSGAKTYTDEAVAAIPTPDVSGQIAEHNAAEDAHGDLRELLRGAVGLPEYDPQTYALTFTAQSGATVVVDLPLEVMGLDYDPATKEMIYTAADGTKRRISLADFVDIYIGSVGPEIQITVDAGNVIRAKLLDGSVGWAHLTTDLRSRIGSKVDAIPGKGLSANDYTDADKAEVAKIAGKAEAVKTYTTTVNTPVWTFQPTVEGELDSAFVAHPEDFYFVTLRAADGEALPAGQFRLTPSLDAAYAADPAKAIDQTFTLAGLQTGNSGVLKESLPVDFLAVGEAWRMRSGGVTAIKIKIEEPYRQGYDLNIYSVSKVFKGGYSYYSPLEAGSISEYYFALSGVGFGYSFGNQFLLGPPSWANARKHSFSNEVFRLRMLPTMALVEYSRSMMGFDGTLTNRTAVVNNPADGLRINGVGFSLDECQYPISALTLASNISMTSAYIRRNGSSIRIELIKRT